MPKPQFEYGAILKGSQTSEYDAFFAAMFEYGAILKGSQTLSLLGIKSILFEYGAILKGSQTLSCRRVHAWCVWVWCNFKG